MNIFVLDKNPEVAATYHCDKHVVKMILEYTQILLMAFYRHNLILTQAQAIEQKELVSTIFKDFPRKNEDGSVNPYRVTHMNHPCTVWAAESKENFTWLLQLLGYLHTEYWIRYGRYRFDIDKPYLHACHPIYVWMCFRCNKITFPHDHRTEFVQAMPEVYRDIDTVKAYRNYYIGDKSKIAKWTNRNIPYWYSITYEEGEV